MKIKHIVLSLAISLGFCHSVSAQRGAMEARVDLGYGFPSGIQTFPVPNIAGNTATNVNFSFGSGVNVALAGTYWLSDNIGAGLDLNYLFGSSYAVSQDHSSYTENYVFSGSAFMITPNIVLSAHSDKINPYGRFGLVIGLPSITSTYSYSGTNPPQTGSDIEVLSGGAAIGWYAAFGLQFPLTDKLALNVELFDRDLSYAPTLGVNKQAFDGVTPTPNTTFVDKIDVSSTSTANSELKSYDPFSSAGIKIGLSMKIGG